jgi:hypothetical protein
LKGWLILLGLVLLSAPEIRSQENFRAWVGLYDPAQIGRLENENRLGELCTDPSTLTDCRSEHLASSVSVYPCTWSPTAYPVESVI